MSPQHELDWATRARPTPVMCVEVNELAASRPTFSLNLESSQWTGPPGTIEYLVPASMFVPVTYPAIKLRGWSFLNGPADASQVIAETEGRRLFAPCKVDAKLNLATEGNASPHEFGLAPLGVADCLREREDFSGACDWHNQHAVIIAEDQVLAAHRPISHGGGLQRILGSDVEALRAGWDRSQAEDRQADRPYVSCVAMEPPDNDSFQPSGLNL
jgi:hypothetical protein